jgi:BirA family biotin operon repressor/biotin-[acetyl-CoA-carboxylase] ligase
MNLPLIRLRVVDSTQAFLERHPELGFCGVLAGAQTQGVGRRGNSWESALDQGLWLSAALPVPAVAPGLVPQRAMAAVAEALADCGVDLGLKWPNDLVAWRGPALVKLGGIIGQSKGGRILLGVGVNLHSAPVIPGRVIAPACLADLTPGAIPDPATLARAILEAWAELDIHREPAFLWPAPGDPVRWEAGEGICQDWLADGRLAVWTAAGLVNLTAGDLVGLA